MGLQASVYSCGMILLVCFSILLNHSQELTMWYSYWVHTNLQSLPFTTASLFFVCLLGILWMGKNKKGQRKTLKVQNRTLPGPGHHIFGGIVNVLALSNMKTTLNVMESWCRMYGPVFKGVLANKSVIILNSPEYAQKLLGSTDINHFDKGFIYEPFKPFWNDGLIVSTGEKWKQRRKLLDKHMFSYKTLLGYMQIFNEEAAHLVRSVGDTDSTSGITIDHLLKSATLNAILKATLGKQVADLESDEAGELSFTELVNRAKPLITKRITNPWLLFDSIWRLHPLSKVQDYISQRFWKQMRNAITDPVSESGENNNVSLKHDLLAAGVTFEGVLEETATLLSAGSETTENALQLLLFMLTLHPRHQELCRKEIDSLFGNTEDSTLHYRDLSQLKHLEMCVNETLRLFPVVFFILRKLKAPLRLEEDLELGAGTEVAIYLPGIHKNPSIYPNPNEFIPERFSPEECQQRHQYAHIPFAMGPRKCIGFKFAIMEMMCLSAMLLRHYVISTPDKLEDITLLPYITLTLENPVNFGFEKRTATM